MSLWRGALLRCDWSVCIWWAGLSEEVKWQLCFMISLPRGGQSDRKLQASTQWCFEQHANTLMMACEYLDWVEDGLQGR